jgi:hypothetical protein
MSEYREMNEEEIQLFVETIGEADLTQVNTVLDDFENESDRAVVVLGVCLLDQLVLELISAYILPPKNPKKDELIGVQKPLGTFSSRIDSARRLGLIGDNFARSLHVIRKIRNEVAHNINASGLDESPNKERIAGLINSAFVSRDLIIQIAANVYSGNGPASQFRVLVSFMAAALKQSHALVRKVEPRRLVALPTHHAEDYVSSQSDNLV